MRNPSRWITEQAPLWALTSIQDIIAFCPRDGEGDKDGTIGVKGGEEKAGKRRAERHCRGREGDWDGTSQDTGKCAELAVP